MYTTNNIFNYGETGERLSGVRESEIYQQSAQRIENFVINEMGNLKIAKKIQGFEVHNLPINIENIFDTKYNFYIVVGSDKIVTLNKNFENNSNAVLYQHNIGVNKNIRYVDEKLFVIDNSGMVKVYEFQENGNIGESNFMSLVRFPIKDKIEITLDLYKVYKVGNEFRLSLLGSYKSPYISIKNYYVYLSNSGTKIDRMFVTYKPFQTAKDLLFPAENQVIGVFYANSPWYPSGNFFIGNTMVAFDKPSSMPTVPPVDGSELHMSVVKKLGNENYEIIGGNAEAGEFSFGKIVDLKTSVSDIGIYRDRLFFVKENEFYFSEISNYFNFRNNIRQSDPFFFKPTPINNVYPNIFKVEVGNKIYVATNKGVYVISAYQTFSSTSYSIFVASEIPCREAGVLIKDDFYYISTENSLKCVQIIPNAQGYESYSVVDVEKYDIYTECEKIEKWKYDDRLMLVATKKKKNSNETKFNKLCLYQALDFNLFRRFTINIDFSIEKGKLLTLDKYLVKDKSLFREGNNNVSKALLRINTPATSTKIGGRYGNDYSSQVERVFIKVLNQDQEAIKLINIDGTSIEKFPGEDDLFSVFRLDKSFPILNGYDIEVITKENDKIFEILGIDTDINVNGD